MRASFLHPRALGAKIFTFLCLSLFLAACGAPRREASYEPLGDGKSFRYKEIGVASWYGKEYHGRNTSNGEVYNMYALTAAHPTLPFQTLVRVTNLENGKATDLRINDRGPFVEGRIIDLSYSGALEIGMVERGTAPVAIEAVLSGEGKASPLEGIFAVQVGAFAEKENAERLRRQLEKKYDSVRTVPQDGSRGRLYRVRLGAFRTETEARRHAEELRRDNLPGFVVRED